MTSIRANALLLTWVLVILCTCKSPDYFEESSDHFQEVVAIEQIGQMSLQLDSVTPTESNCIKYLKTDSGSFVVSLNHLDNSIIFYDYNTGRGESKFIIPQRGPNGIGSLESFSFLEGDSILAVSQNYYAGIYSWNGDLIAKWPRIDQNIKLSPITTSGNPAVWRNDELYQPGFYMGSRDHQPVLVSPVAGDSSYATYQLPDEYREGFWGPGEFDLYFSCYNQEEDLFVYSFPPSINIHITDHRNVQLERYGGSTHFGKTHPLSHRRIKSSKEIEASTMLRPIFQEIIYDKFNKCYYRIAELPLTEEELMSISDIYMPGVRDFSIIVLDKDFRKIGESSIIDRGLYDSRIFFVTEKGLHLKQLDKDSEDSMSFTIFNLKSLEL